MSQVFITGVSEDDAAGDLAEYYASQRAAWGFLPNYAPRSRPAPTSRRRGTRSTRPSAAAWTVAASRSPPSPRPAHAVDLLHRGPLDVLEGRLRRRGRDGVHRRAPRRSGAPTAGPRRLPVRRQGRRGRGRRRRRTTSTPAHRRTHRRRVADVVFAASARCFFTAVLDGLGAQLDVQTAQTLPAALLDSMVVGRPVAGG